ncbi:MAG TPA: cytochrome c [Bryobacteraceae bacterium]|jgi:mono/diheme cytochrome c family protein|nr:cytochrome c [Bryobacteraceae bacterium]
MKAFAGLIALAAIAQAHDISSQVTWSREISRLLDRHCTSCHREGGSAFSLAAYAPARAHAQEILKDVLDRRMPPFGAVKGFGELRDDHSLTQEQIALVVNWVQGGAPQGDPALAPKTPPQKFDKPEPKAGAEWIAGASPLGAAKTFIGIRPESLHGDSIRVIAALPDGTDQPLVWFYHYDPKFARTYFFRKPLRLPAGTKIITSVPGVTVALIEPAR